MKKEELLSNGWTKITSDSDPLRFRSPDGKIFSHSSYHRYTSAARNGSPPKPRAIPDPITVSREPETDDEPNDFIPEDAVPELPKAQTTKARPLKSGSQQASARELASAFQTNLLILTAIIALIAKSPELQMTEDEANAIGIPLANLFERSEMNKRIGRQIAGSSDYGILIYAVYHYLHRVSTTVREKKNAQPPGYHTTAPPTANGAATSQNGALMPYRTKGIGGITPIT